MGSCEREKHGWLPVSSGLTMKNTEMSRILGQAAFFKGL
jgi:hypothetical protein